MFISSIWDFKEPTHFSRKVGHEVPSFVAVIPECMGGYREVVYLAWDISSGSCITCTSVQNWAKTGPVSKKVSLPFDLGNYIQQ